MANPYQIDWQPPNLAPGLSLLINARNANRENERADRNAETQAEFARQNLEREKSRDYYERMKFEQDQGDRQEKAFSSAKLMFQQGDKAGALSLLKRHGIAATPETGPATTTPATLLTPADVLASQSQAPQEAVGASPQAPLTPANVMAMGHHDDPGAHAGVTVPEEPPQMPQVPPPEVAMGHQGPGHAVEDLLPMELEPEKTTPGGPTGAYSFRGQQGQDLGRYEPAGPMSSGLGPDYDKLYESLVHGGADPTEARKDVFALYKNEQTDKGRDKRLADAIAGRSANREDQQQFIAGEHAKYDQTADVKTQLRREAIRAMASQAAARIGTQAETSADRTIGTYMNIAKEAKAAAGSKSDIQGMRPINRIMEELANPDPIVQKTAIESMATIAVGGHAPIAVLHQLSEPMGLMTTYENKLYQLTHDGMNMPKVNEAFRQAALKLQTVSKAQRVNDFNAWENAAGRKSRWYNPAMAPFVDDQRKATLDELGLSEGDVTAVPQQESDMGINPGMGTQTRPQGLHPKPGPHMKPAKPASSVHPSQAAPGETKTLPDGTVIHKVGPNNWQPVQQ